MPPKEQSQKSAKGNIILTGHIDVPEERLDAVQAALPVHIALTRAEKGCLAFNVVPCPEIGRRFLVSERFANQRSFDAHQVRTKTSSWARVTKGIARDYSIKVQD